MTVGYVVLCIQCYDKLSYTVQVSDVLPLWAVESSYKILNVMSLDKMSSGVQFSCIFCTLKCNSNKFNRSILLTINTMLRTSDAMFSDINLHL